MTDAQQVGTDFVAAFNAHDEARIRALNAENAVFEGPGDVHLEGRDAVTEYALSWLRAFPDATLNVGNELQAGDWVVQEFTSRALTPARSRAPPATFRRRIAACRGAACRSSASTATRSPIRASTSTRSR